MRTRFCWCDFSKWRFVSIFEYRIYFQRLANGARLIDNRVCYFLVQVETGGLRERLFNLEVAKPFCFEVFVNKTLASYNTSITLKC